MQAFYNAGKMEIRLLQAAVAVTSLLWLTCLILQEWITLGIFTIILIPYFWSLDRAKKTYAQTFRRRELRRQLQELIRNEPSWMVQCDRGVIGVDHTSKRVQNIFRISMEDFNDGYNFIDHTVETPVEIFHLSNRVADAIRLLGVSRFEEKAAGNFVLKDELAIEMNKQETARGLKNGLIIASEEELQSIIDDVKYALAYAN